VAVPTVLERLTALLESRYVDGNVENNAVLDALLGGISDAADRLGIVGYGSDAIPAEQALTDPAVAPDWSLAHAAQYTGAKLPGRNAGESFDDWLVRARDATVYPEGIKRGTEEAMRRAAAPYLAAGAEMTIAYTGDPFEVAVSVPVADILDEPALLLALSGDFVSGGHRGAIPAHHYVSFNSADVPLFSEATLNFSDLPATVTANNVTLGDVT
jgi:hypothetical protein